MGRGFSTNVSLAFRETGTLPQSKLMQRRWR